MTSNLKYEYETRKYTALKRHSSGYFFLLMNQHTPAAELPMKITYDQFVVLQNGLQGSQLGLDK